MFLVCHSRVLIPSSNEIWIRLLQFGKWGGVCIFWWGESILLPGIYSQTLKLHGLTHFGLYHLMQTNPSTLTQSLWLPLVLYKVYWWVWGWTGVARQTGECDINVGCSGGSSVENHGQYRRSDSQFWVQMKFEFSYNNDTQTWQQTQKVRWRWHDLGPPFPKGMSTAKSVVMTGSAQMRWEALILKLYGRKNNT